MPLDRDRGGAAQIAGRLLARDVVPVLVELRGRSAAPATARSSPRLAKDYGVLPVEDALADILLDPRLKSDQIHPNALGYQKLAEAVAEEVQPLIEARGRR